MQALRFIMSSNLTAKGIKINNSPEFHLRFDNCTNVLIDTLNINSPALSRNTDGIHIENTNNVAIYNSLISSGNPNSPSSFFLLAVISVVNDIPSSLGLLMLSKLVQVMIAYHLELALLMFT